MMHKVTLREKPLLGGKLSLYLDIYPPIINNKNGKLTRRHFLNLHVLDKPKTQIEKKYKRENIELAEAIRQKREYEINKSEVYNDFELEQLKKKKLGLKNVLQFFEEIADKRKGSNYENWTASIEHFKKFNRAELTFKDLDENFIESFKDYLLNAKSRRDSSKSISQNTALSYFNKFKVLLKEAYKEGFIQVDLNSRVKAIKEEETRREHLSLEELNILAKSECKSDLLKRASLFSALTGLRFSDIEKLKWDEIKYSESHGYYLEFRQKKTKGIETLPISDQARALMIENDSNSEYVFDGLIYYKHANRLFKEWIKSAGINRNITFHCLRHTNATLLLSEGAGMATISGMLGHKNLKTTQLYAKVIDQTKREAANKIKLDI